MSSSLRLITSNLLTRSFCPTLVSASRFLSTDAASKDESGLRSLSPIISKITFSAYLSSCKRSFDLHMDGVDDSENLNVFLEAPHEALPNQGKTHRVRYLLRPTKTSSDSKGEMKDGMVNLPNRGDLLSNIGASIIASFNRISAKHSWCYYDMFFDRSILGRELCPIIAKPSSINSYSLCKKEDAERLRISMDMPGNGKMKLTIHGLTMSLEMQGVERERVKTFFEYDTFFIEGKSKSDHYITGIHIPEGIHKKHNMIKKMMKDGVFYATIACRVKKEELREIKDQLNPAKSLKEELRKIKDLLNPAKSPKEELLKIN